MKSKADVMKDLGKVLRRKVVIQKFTVTEDELGNQTQEWVDWKTLRVARDNLWGQEYYAAKAVNEENTLVFTTRYAPFIDEVNAIEYRVKHEDKVYDIKQIDHLQDDGLWVKIKALERGVNG